ncbi:MAG TPA: LapA family protein [Pseudomonas sp.]|nr:LapA family protein [Pseudomonas sp.]
MLWFKRMALLSSALLLALVTVTFFLENQAAVVLSFIGWRTPELPLSFFVVLAFAAGGLIGVLLGQVLAVRYKARLSAVRKELAHCRAALEGGRSQA